MTSEHDHSDLTELFTAEDDALASEAFIKSVMAPIRKRARARQALLFGAGGIGIGAALSQLAAFAGTWESSGSTARDAMPSLQDQLVGLTSTIDPIWLLTAGMIALCVALMAVLERA